MLRIFRTFLPALMVIGVCSTFSSLRAQTFETAAVHPSTVSDGCTNLLPPGSGRFEATCVPLRALVELAFRPDELEGPGVLDTLYDVQATTPEGKPWTMESARPMLQALLVERFHLTFHSQAKSVTGYELVNGPQGNRLKPAPAQVAEVKHGESTSFLSAGHVAGKGLTMDAIASMLGLAQQAHIVDGTHLKGTFDLDLRYAPEDSTASDLPQFSTAIKEQLGLELKRTSVPITVMVVDHVDATPIAN